MYPGTGPSFVLELREVMDNAGQEYIDDLVGRGMELIEDVLPMAKLGQPTNLRRRRRRRGGWGCASARSGATWTAGVASQSRRQPTS